MELKQYLKLQQQLVMTPQLQQAIKLLQLSRAELSEVVREEMMENPVLEELQDDGSKGERDVRAEREERIAAQHNDGQAQPDAPTPPTQDSDTSEVPRDEKDFNWESFVENYNNYNNNYTPGYRLSDEEAPSIEQTLSRRSTLFDHLVWQLKMSNLRRDEEEVAMSIIGNIDDDGYLSGITLDEIAEQCDATVDAVEDVLCLVHEFDPVGVGARDLRESLLIQAEYYYPTNHLLKRLIRDHLEDLEKRQVPPILKALNIKPEELAKLARVIGNMEPKPGRCFTSEEPHYITPDVYVFKLGDEFVVMLNEDGMPKLKISQFYRNAMGTGSQVTKDYIQNKFRSAVWLIRSIHQRQNTIRKVTESLVKFQREFFERGVQYLRPLILRDVAEDIGMHESTVSRVTTSKYVHTPQGIFELKYFFNSKITGTYGQDLASESVKQKIKQLIAGEDPRHPYSDQRIAEILQEQNIEIARRTVAKYREMLGILSSSKRKKLF
ncbi:MAG: RNA polymerase factor sigma-54 [Myxococcales bacterium]|nr:RNA polymerase factor sigma-54 [Myxococcales bacterium]